MTCNRCGHSLSYTTMPGNSEEEKKAEAQYRMQAHAEACALQEVPCLHAGELLAVGIPGFGMCSRCKAAVHIFKKAAPAEEEVAQ